MSIDKACPMVVKICGITNLQDALGAVEAGADMLGFNFYPPGKRYILPEECRKIISILRFRKMNVVTVGVFVNAPVDMILSTMRECGLHLAQLSGDETPETLFGLAGTGFKALHVSDSTTLQISLRRYPRRALPPAYLVDAYSPGEYGGTGKTIDWSLAARISAQMPILLAGGLTTENVAKAVAQVHPWGVDVASGVESSPGCKDHAKIALFIQKARRAAENCA